MAQDQLTPKRRPPRAGIMRRHVPAPGRRRVVLCTALLAASLGGAAHASGTAPGAAPGAASEGSAVAGRTAAARAADSFNVLDHGLVADCKTSNTPALAALLARAAAASAASGGQSEVVFPAAGACYGFASVVPIPAGVRITGLGRPTLSALGSTGALFSMANVGNVAVVGLRLDSRSGVHPTIAMPITISGATGGVLIEDVELVSPTGEIHVADSHGVTISRPVVNGSRLHGVLFSGVRDSEVVGGRFQDEVGFGVVLTDGSHRNLVQGNQTTANGIELIGVTQDSYENRIIGNHAEGTGDNCISITGYDNVVLGNVVKGCQGNGIEVFGERNLVIGNSAHNNARGHAANSGWCAGIAIQGGFGGVAQYNVVSGNIVDDDQMPPTQLYGIWLGKPPYRAWAANQAVAAGAFRSSGAHLYKATTAGTTASTAPNWLDTASDGAVTWQRVRGLTAGTALSDHNEIAGNVVARYGVAPYSDNSGGSQNGRADRSAAAPAAGGGVRQALTGTAYAVPADAGLVRFVQAGVVASQTVTLPSTAADGQAIQFVNYAGTVRALAFKPAVNGWPNGSALAANTGLRVRWDETAAAWQREQ